MIRVAVVALSLVLVPVVAPAQTDTVTGDGDDVFTLTPELDLEGAAEDGSFEESVEDVQRPQATTADGAVLRGLDRVTGALEDLELANGESRKFGRLAVTVSECRFPAGNPAGDAYAYLVIRAEGAERPAFEGWMIASSPALNALDHPRYDVWVLRCITS